MRVEIPAYSNRWMMGDRYGEVTWFFGRRGGDGVAVCVKLDKSSKTVRVIFEDCKVLDRGEGLVGSP